jgi:YhcN/YlaJ family sporulation lipoprotein
MRKTIALLFCISIGLAGCNNKDRIGMDKGNLKEMANTNSERTPNSQVDSPLVEEKSEEIHQSKDLVQLIEQVDGVRETHVIVSGIYTVVGIETDTNERGNENEPLRKEVYDAIKGNAHGRNAAITTDPEKIDQIKKLGKKIKQSRYDLQGGVYNELGVLIGQIKPVPGHYKSTERQEMHKEMDHNRNDLYE